MIQHLSTADNLIQTPGGCVSRGIFNFKFQCKLLPLTASAMLNPSKPFETLMIMDGNVFAIELTFLWELSPCNPGVAAIP